MESNRNTVPSKTVFIFVTLNIPAETCVSFEISFYHSSHSNEINRLLPTDK